MGDFCLVLLLTAIFRCSWYAELLSYSLEFSGKRNITAGSMAEVSACERSCWSEGL